MKGKWKTIVRREDYSLLVLHCCQCHHEIEMPRYEEQTCDWCGGNMVIIGEGTTWPNASEFRIIAKQLNVEKKEAK